MAMRVVYANTVEGMVSRVALGTRVTPSLVHAIQPVCASDVVNQEVCVARDCCAPTPLFTHAILLTAAANQSASTAVVGASLLALGSATVLVILNFQSYKMASANPVATMAIDAAQVLIHAKTRTRYVYQDFVRPFIRLPCPLAVQSWTQSLSLQLEVPGKRSLIPR